MKLARLSRPDYLMLMLPVCLIGGLFAGGYLGGWLRYMAVDSSMPGPEHTFDYEWSLYIIGGAILGAVIGGVIAFCIGNASHQVEEDP